MKIIKASLLLFLCMAVCIIPTQGDDSASIDQIYESLSPKIKEEVEKQVNE